MNLISTFNNYDGSAKFRKLKRNFINEPVVSFWNKLPTIGGGMGGWPKGHGPT